MTTVSVVSDLHLEFADVELPGGDVLILAGDIWLARDMRPRSGNANLRERYARFCIKEMAKYERVLLITGNHEAYGSNIDEMNDTIRSFLHVHATNARLLHNDVAVIDDVAFLGTPLWATCGVGNADDERDVAAYLNDFRLIRTNAPYTPGQPLRWVGNERVFTVHDACGMHRDALVWLNRELPRHKRCVVIGHHAPSFKSVGGHSRSKGGSKITAVDSAYCSDLDHMIRAHPQIAVWIHGHTHCLEDYAIGRTRIIANPRGYWPDERVSLKFNPRRVDFTIDSLFESAAA